MNMTKVTLSVLIITGVCIIGAILYTMQDSRAHEAVESLKGAPALAIDERNTLRKQLEQAEDKIIELQKRHEEAPHLRESSARQPRPSGTASEAARPGIKRRTEWRNVGLSTPEACIETSMWAEMSGDVEVMRELLVIDTPVLKKAQSMLERLPEEGRARFGPPDRIIALGRMNREPIAAYEVVNVMQNPKNADEVALRLRLTSGAGQVYTQNTELRRTPGGWRVRIPAQLVDASIVELLSGSNHGRP